MTEQGREEKVILSVEKFLGDRLAAEVWVKKYAARYPDGTLRETHPNHMFQRLAHELAKIEYEYYCKRKKRLYLNPWLKKQLSSQGLEYYNTKLTFRKIYVAILSLLENFGPVILGGSMMASLGLQNYSSISNCFVIGQPEDSINGINAKRAEQSNLMKRRGGVGKDLSLLRPRGARVHNAANTSTGAASFMNVDSEVTREIAQEGRRGALMLSMHVHHPDILEFITAKQDETSITGANISVKLSDEFMEAIDRKILLHGEPVVDDTFVLRFPVDYKFAFDGKSYDSYLRDYKASGLDNLEYDKLHTLRKGDQIIYVKKIHARELWKKIIDCSWNRAEPGVMFEDTHINYSPDGVYPQYRGVTTNPCGEIFMQPYDSCRLIHHNLVAHLARDKKNQNYSFDFDTFRNVAYYISFLADDLVDLEVKALDSIIGKLEKENNPLDKEELIMWKKLRANGLMGRRCGIGITGLADVVAKCGYKYGSLQSNILEESIFATKLDAELAAQGDLAILRGPFKGWDRTLEFDVDPQSKQLVGKNPFYRFLTDRVLSCMPNSNPQTLTDQAILDRYNNLLRLYKYGRRNVSWSTVAPTGTVSLLCGTTSGIEPLFLPYYIRSRKVTTEDKYDYVDKNGDKFINYLIIHKGLKEWIHDNYPEFTDFNNLGEITKLYEKSPYCGACAPDLTVKQRIHIQSIAQTYTTHSISSTVNLPKETTPESISEIFRAAYKTKLKGITIYRDGCRTGILNKVDAHKEEFPQYSAPKRPKVLQAESYVVKAKGKSYAIIIGLLLGKPYEVFAAECPKEFIQQQGTITKVKKHVYKWIGANGDTIENIRTMSESIEERACTLYISMLLRHGVKISYVIKTARKVDDNIVSFTSAICRVLSKYIPKEDTVQSGEVCPQCGEPLIHEAGCVRCSKCTYTVCLIISKL